VVSQQSKASAKRILMSNRHTKAALCVFSKQSAAKTGRFRFEKTQSAALVCRLLIEMRFATALLCCETTLMCVGILRICRMGLRGC
jgi:hypothetical protein